MLYLTCTMVSSIDLAYYGVSRAKDLISVDRGTRICYNPIMQQSSDIAKSELLIRGGIDDKSKIIFLISQRKHILNPSLEPSQRDGSNDGSQNTFFYSKNIYYYSKIIPVTPSYLERRC